MGHHPVGDAGQRHRGERDSRGDAKDVSVVRSAELRRFAVVGDRADQAPQTRTGQEELEQRQHQHGHTEDGERHVGDVDDRGGVPRLRDERADVNDLAVRRVDLEQKVLDHDREAKGHEQRGEGVAVDALLDQRALDEIANQPEQGHDDEERPHLGQAQMRRQEDRDVSRYDRDVAVGEVDDL